MKSKKDLLGGLIIIVLLLLVLVTYMSFYNLKKDEEKNLEIKEIEDNSLFIINIYDDYSTSKVMDKSNIDSSKNVVGSYNCKFDDCDVYKNDLVDSIFENKYIILKENNKILIYDLVVGKVVSNLYDDIISVYDNYYVVKSNEGNGLISKSGIEIVEPSYTEILFEEKYDSYIKVSYNNLYGIVDLDNGSVIVDTKYNDIRFNDSKYFSILKDDLWYVIDNTGKIVTDGYKYTFAFNKGYIALVDDNLKIFKYNNSESEHTIPLGLEYKVSRKGNSIFIEMKNEDSAINYEYSINRNNLVTK